MKNTGKIFEEDFSKSVPSYCMLHRLKDTAQSYNNSERTKFTWNNPCDYFLYDTTSHLLFAIECKTTKDKAMSVQLEEKDSNKKMVKYHQIESLNKLSEYDGIIAGLLLNFRHFEGEENYIENTYFQSIGDFKKMMNKIGKKSFNELDLLVDGNVISVSGHKKRTRWAWDIDSLLKNLTNKYIHK